MKPFALIALLAVAASSAPASVTNVTSLSDDELKQALSGSGRDHWVFIMDSGLIASGTSAWGGEPSITLFMPEAVLAARAETAKKAFRQYEPTEEDKRKSLMVVAKGYVGKTVRDGCTSITRILLLSNPAGKVVREAYLSEPWSETWSNAFGASNQCQALRAKFSLEDVQAVKAAAAGGEFYIAAFSGDALTKTYKIKHKHQSKLGLR